MKRCLCIVGAVAALSACAATGHHDEMTEVARSIDELPDPVARTLLAELGDHEATEIEEIRYEGVAVLYEAEYGVDGAEHEIAIRPDGALVEAGTWDDDDDDDDDD